MHCSVRQLARLLIRSAVCAAVIAPLAAQAETFPERPIRLVNVFSAGGPTDVALRIIAAEMTKSLGQTVIVDPRPGAAGMIAAGHVATQPGDGYTLLLANNQTNSNSLLYKKMSYKTSDFTPVSLIMKTVNVMCVPASLPVNNMKEFVEYAKQRPGQVNYAILGPGGSPHVNGKMLEKSAGIKMTEVSYKGAAQATQDLLAGHVQAMFITTSGAVPLEKSGLIKILGQTGPERIETAPNIPTIKEQGYDVVSQSWFALVAPASTPKDRIGILNQAIVKAVNSPEFQEKMKAGGNTPAASTPEELTRLMQDDYASWEAILKPMNLQLD